MKNNHLILATLFTILAINACSKAPENNITSTSTNQVVQDNSGKTVLYWYDPMVADKKFDKPGKSPFMDMQLIPKYKEPNKEGAQP